MHHSHVLRLRANLRSTLAYLRWKIGVAKKPKPLERGTFTHLPNGDLLYIPPAEAKR